MTVFFPVASQIINLSFFVLLRFFVLLITIKKKKEDLSTSTDILNVSFPLLAKAHHLLYWTNSSDFGDLSADCNLLNLHTKLAVFVLKRLTVT